ncbi:MAG: CoA pyrophosphatase [Pseudomonadota bacterium]
MNPPDSVPPDTPLSKLPNFDPRAVPVIGIDAHLPLVSAQVLAPAAIRARFLAPPNWEPEIWSERKFAERDPARASVLIPIVLRERPTVLLTERSTHLSTHSGQVAFPGGKQDETDPDEIYTALREAQEEIGLAPGLVEVIGQLPTYTTGTRFIITPVVALVNPAHALTLNAFEVADAFEIPLDFLMNPNHHRRHALEWAGARREWFSISYMDGANERFVWGATAAMLRNLYRFLIA